MIESTSGDLLSAPVEGLVNAVNTVGVMGKGIALQFRQAFPAMFIGYADACARGDLRMGRLHVFDRGVGCERARWIINFPTKRHWREPSTLDDIVTGLPLLVQAIVERRISSVAVPALGCGLGGLPWREVRPRIEAAFAPLADVRVLLYGPAGPVLPQR